MSTVDQKLLVEGEIQIITTESLGETRGRVLFIDVNNNEFGSFRVFGQYPFARLILDSAGLTSGVAFRTNSRQGTIADGGEGEKYTAEISTSGFNGTYLSLYPPTRNLPYVEQRGRPMMDIGRDGTADATNLYNSISKFSQSQWRINEDVYINVDRGGLTSICMGINTLSVDAIASDTPFIGVAGTTSERPAKVISFNTQNSTLGSDNSALIANVNGLVAVPQNFYVGQTIEVGTKYASFDRASTNFLTLPVSSLTFTTTGVSFLMVVRFTGVAGNNERIFEYAGGLSGNNSFSVGRSGTTNTLQCVAYNTTTQVGLLDGVGNIVQDAWTIISVVYTQTSSTIDLYQDGVKVGSVVCTAPISDRITTTSGSYLGRSSFSANSYTNYHLGALYVYNSKLTSTQISSVTMLNYDTRPSTFTPTYSFVGQRLRFKNNEKISGWSGSTQATVARQPTTKVEGLLYSSSGTSLVGNLNITGNYLVNGQPVQMDLLPITLDKVNNRVGINNAAPTFALDVSGSANVTGSVTGAYLAAVQDLSVGGAAIVDGLVGVGNLNPVYKVDVAGDTNVSGAYKINGNNVLTSTTLGTSIVNSSLTSVGTLTNLTVSGNIAGTLTTASQPNVTSLGTLTNVNTSGVYQIGGVDFVASRNTGAVAMGPSAGTITQGLGAIAVGQNAGNTVQGAYSLAVGYGAGQTTQGGNSVAVGSSAGTTSQGDNTVAVGVGSGNSLQGSQAVAVGKVAGGSNQGPNAVAVGSNAAQSGQGSSAIAVGFAAGQTNQHANSVILNASGAALNSDGTSRFYVKPVRNNTTATSLLQYDATSGEITYGPSNVAGTLTTAAQPNVTSVGTLESLSVTGAVTAANLGGTLTTAAQPNITSLGTLTTLTVNGGAVVGWAYNSVAVGSNAGWGGGANVKQGTRSVAIGPDAGYQAQQNLTVAIGSETGKDNQGVNAVAIGNSAGKLTQGSSSVAIGTQAGSTSQGASGVAIGTQAGYQAQQNLTVAIGSETGKDNQGVNAVAIGNSAGKLTQGVSGVAIGTLAGSTSQGSNAIAIGYGAGQTNQHANSIILNASGTALNSDNTSRFYVKPVRNNTTATSLLQYNATSGEITYGPSNIAGTLTTAAQPNVTSVGTLTSVTLSGGPVIQAGAGSPETVITAPIGSLYLRSDGGAGTCLYVKESGTGNTGWIAK